MQRPKGHVWNTRWCVLFDTKQGEVIYQEEGEREGVFILYYKKLEKSDA